MSLDGCRRYFPDQVRYNPNSFVSTLVVAVELIQRQQQGAGAV
jgi:hypothetical protein